MELSSPFELRELCREISLYLRFEDKLSFASTCKTANHAEVEVWSQCRGYPDFEMSSFHRVRDFTTKAIRMVCRDGSIGVPWRLSDDKRREGMKSRQRKRFTRVSIWDLYACAYLRTYLGDNHARFVGRDPIRFDRYDFEMSTHVCRPEDPEDLLAGGVFVDWNYRTRMAHFDTSAIPVGEAPLEYFEKTLAHVYDAVPEIEGWPLRVRFGFREPFRVTCADTTRDLFAAFHYDVADDPRFADLNESARLCGIEFYCTCPDFFEHDEPNYFGAMFD